MTRETYIEVKIPPRKVAPMVLSKAIAGQGMKCSPLNDEGGLDSLRIAHAIWGE